MPIMLTNVFPFQEPNQKLNLVAHKAYLHYTVTVVCISNLEKMQHLFVSKVI